MSAWNSIPGRRNSMCKENLECLRNGKINRFARTDSQRPDHGKELDSYSPDWL